METANGKTLRVKAFTAKEMATLGILSAIGIVLGLWVMIPLIPSAPFLKYDPADVPIFMGSLMFGPLAGVMMTIVISVAHSLFEGVSGISGLIMHIAATGSAAFVIGTIYRFRRARTGSIVSVLCGALAMTALMIPLNLIVTPLFTGWPVEAVVELLLPAIIPFNLLKAGINGALSLALYHALAGAKIINI
ncbi:MAG: ECF transporter S component [Oscillospiraceae bacterium]|jgi:riboflavin transporter FmnP|nr:ECF transporter S component [Oscillospiraceae bacterium]